MKKVINVVNISEFENASEIDVFTKLNMYKRHYRVSTKIDRKYSKDETPVLTDIYDQEIPGPILSVNTSINDLEIVAFRRMDCNCEDDEITIDIKLVVSWGEKKTEDDLVDFANTPYADDVIYQAPLKKFFKIIKGSKGKKDTFGIDVDGFIEAISSEFQSYESEDKAEEPIRKKAFLFTVEFGDKSSYNGYVVALSAADAVRSISDQYPLKEIMEIDITRVSSYITDDGNVIIYLSEDN